MASNKEQSCVPSTNTPAAQMPLIEPTYAISIKDSPIGLPYQKFHELLTHSHLSMKYLDLLEQKLRVAEVLQQYRAIHPECNGAGASTSASDAKYQRLRDKLPSPEAILATVPSSITGTKQKIGEVIMECNDELRYLYNLYTEECINIEINKIREALVS